jgi:DNA mismatch repair ATPase MutS
MEFALFSHLGNKLRHHKSEIRDAIVEQVDKFKSTIESLNDAMAHIDLLDAFTPPPANAA